MANLHVLPYHQWTVHLTPVRQVFLTWDPVRKRGRGRIHFKPCRTFRSEEGVVDKKKDSVRKGEILKVKNWLESKKGVNKLLRTIRSVVWRYSKPSSRSDAKFREALKQLEEKLSWVAIQFARYIVTMMSTGVILLIGFQLSGGDGQMNALIWYSWLGGIVIGTMIGSNMVLDEVSRAGPRNVVITGSTRGLGKALAREFLLSGDRVVVTSRSPESVDTTMKVLEENLKQVLVSSDVPSSKKLAQAKVVGVASDVSVSSDVQKLANYAIKELGSIDIWLKHVFKSRQGSKVIVSTNLVGSILCTRETMRIMQRQKQGGQIFNMDGAGSGRDLAPSHSYLWVNKMWS